MICDLDITGLLWCITAWQFIKTKPMSV